MGHPVRVVFLLDMGASYLILHKNLAGASPYNILKLYWRSDTRYTTKRSAKVMEEIIRLNNSQQEGSLKPLVCQHL